MSESETIARVRKARAALLMSHPFFGVLALKLHIRETETDYERAAVPTAGVNTREMIFNPAFVCPTPAQITETGRQPLTQGEIKGLIAHEVMHLALTHHARQSMRDHTLWNIACISGDTPITMADGSERFAADVCEGDMVWSPNGPSRVLKVLDKGHREVVSLTHSAGICHATPDHRFLTMKGFASADTQDSGMQWEVLRLSRSARFYPRELQNHVNSGPNAGDENHLRQCGHVPGTTGLDGGSIHREAQNYWASAQDAPTRVGVPRRDNRRGGNNNGSDKGWLCPAAHNHSEHLDVVEGLVHSEGIHEYACEEFQGPVVLAAELERVFAESPNAPGKALSGYQGASCGPSVRIHLDTAESVERTGADGTYARDCCDLQMAESTHVTIGRTGETRRVLDFVTTHHVFVAGGLLTHNCDFALNPALLEDGFTLPKGALVHDDFKGMSAEAIYEKLQNMAQQAQAGGGGGKGKGIPGMGADGNPDGQGWGDFESAGPHDSAEANEAARQWAENAAAALRAAKSAGKLPAGIARIVEQSLTPRADWKSLLRRFMTDQVRRTPTWSKPNKRFYPGQYLPGVNKDGMGPIVVGVDTSGSIDAQTLAVFAVEIQTIAQDVEPSAIHVVYCDAAVAGVETYEASDDIRLKPLGGGGTMFSPVFERVAQEGWQPACLIYLTDLYCSDFPTSAPYPVLWAVYGGNEAKAPMGETVRID